MIRPRVALSLLAAATWLAAVPAAAGPSSPGPADLAAVLAEIRGFYRDLAADDWPGLVDRFWPAKVVTRRAPGGGGAAWLRREVGPEALAPAVPRAAGATVDLFGDWARVTVRFAVSDAAGDAGRPVELRNRSGADGVRRQRQGPPPGRQVFWLLRAGGRWKIAVGDSGWSPEGGNRSGALE